MEKLIEGQIIKLNNDKEYVIVNIIDYNGGKYLNLLSVSDNEEMLIVKAEEDYGMMILKETDDKTTSEILDILAD